jgi:hypothetical protein
MDVMVFIALGAAAGVIVLLFLLTRLIRTVRESDEFEFDRPRLLGWRSKSRPPRLAATAGVSKNDPMRADAGLPAAPPRPSERVAAHAPPAAPAPVSPAAIPSTRSVSVKQSRQAKVDEARGSEEAASMAEEEVRVERNAQDGASDYGRLGEQVTAVLTTAESAAADIRESAGRDAEAIRLEAEKQVAEARAEAEALRANADAYRQETHAAADAYATETRRAADAEAATSRAASEDRGRAVLAEAELRAKEIEAEALRRRDMLRESAIDLEERIAGMLTTFRAMTTDLEELLPAEAKREGEPKDANEEVVDDTLEDALKPERAA